jgi:hypothetical protein
MPDPKKSVIPVKIKKTLSGVPNLQFGRISGLRLPNCKFGTPEWLFVKTLTTHKFYVKKLSDRKVSEHPDFLPVP